MFSILEKKRSFKKKFVAVSLFVLMALLVLIPSSFASGVTPQSNQSNLNMLRGSLSYNIGEASTDIYCNGNVTISFSPKGGSSSVGVHVSAYEPGNPVPKDLQSFSGDQSGSVTLRLYGYHYFLVKGDSGVTGTYKVTY